MAYTLLFNIQRFFFYNANSFSPLIIFSRKFKIILLKIFKKLLKLRGNPEVIFAESQGSAEHSLRNAALNKLILGIRWN
jgi:hypothetical protein